jgi:hypothetical protein
MKKVKLKANKGVTITDVVVAVIILSVFTGVVGNLYYLIAKNNNLIKYNTVAVYNAIKIAEDIDKISYDEVTEDLNTNIKDRYNIPEGFSAQVKVVKYSDEDSTKQDIIKRVNITIKYKFLKEDKTYNLEKLKIKEI